MTFLEKIFSRKLIHVDLGYLQFGKQLLLLHLAKKRYTGEEFYPLHTEFRMYQHRDQFIGVLKVKYKRFDLESKVENEYAETIEVRMDGISKSYQYIANKLLNKAVKEFFNKYRTNGYKECLLDYLYIIEEDDDIYKLQLDRVFDKFNKFRSIRILF